VTGIKSDGGKRELSMRGRTAPGARSISKASAITASSLKANSGPSSCSFQLLINTNPRPSSASRIFSLDVYAHAKGIGPAGRAPL